MTLITPQNIPLTLYTVAQSHEQHEQKQVAAHICVESSLLTPKYFCKCS